MQQQQQQKKEMKCVWIGKQMFVIDGMIAVLNLSPELPTAQGP